MLIEKAYNEFHPPPSLFQYVESSAVKETESNSDDYLSGKKMAYIQKDGLCFTTAKGNVSKKVHSMHELEYLIHQINDYFKTFFRHAIIPDTGIGIYTRLKLIQNGEKEVKTDGEMETVLYRGEPFWISNHGAIQENKISDVYDSLYKPDPWHDFAYIEWRTSSSDKSEDVTVIPGRILFFFKIPDDCEGQDPDEEDLIFPTGSYALIQSCVEDLKANPPTSATANKYYREKYQTNTNLPSYLAHPSCSLLCWTMLELTEYTYINENGKFTQQVPKLYVVSITNICGSCLAVPYNLRQQPSIEWIIVQNRHEWNEIMIDDMEERIG
jgi:hypothetical protein